MLSAYWLLPSHEAHLQGAFSMVQSRAPAERQRSQAPPLGLQTREVHCSWKMLVLPGDNYLLLNSAAPVLLKVNPARRKEKKLDYAIICNFELQRCYLHAAKKAAEVFTQTESGFPQLHEFWNVISLCWNYMMLGLQLQGRELDASRYSFPNYIPNPTLFVPWEV